MTDPRSRERLDFDPSLADVAELTQRLGVNPDIGLTAAQAARRLDRDGPNELRSSPAEPSWRRALRQVQDPLVYLLLVAAGISFAAWWAQGAREAPVDAVVIIAVVVANAVLGYVQEAKATDAVAALATMTASRATVLRDGRPQTVPAAQVVVGDVLLLAEGDAVAADGRLVHASRLQLAEASLTGESLPVGKEARTLTAPTAVADRSNAVFKGTAVTRGVGRAIVTATGMGTEMGAIAELLDSTASGPSPLQREIARVSKLLGRLVVAIAVLVMLATVVMNGVHTVDDAVTVLFLGVSLAVAAVPEGLPAILSLVLAIGVRTLARRNAVVKDLHSVETLGSASVICSDKTGTLTSNEMTVRRIATFSGETEVSGIGHDPSGELRSSTRPGGLEAELALFIGSVANDARLVRHLDQWTGHGDPTEVALLVAARKVADLPVAVEDTTRLDELPFDSERKLMSVLAKPPDRRVRLYTKGAPDLLLARCSGVRVGTATHPLDEERRTRIVGQIQALTRQAYRTLGLAYRPADDLDELTDRAESDLVWVGVVGIIDPPRAHVRDAVLEAKRAGIRVVMITGDHPVTAARIAADLGIAPAGAPALTGVDLDALDQDELTVAVRHTHVFARVAPIHKLHIVETLQGQGDVVAMTGDGVNDAPALKTADIGIAMGISGTEVTKEAGNVILGDDNFATIVAAVRQGRVIFDNIQKFLRYLLSSNLAEVVTVFFGVLLAGPIGLLGSTDGVVVPLLAAQILWINLVTDSGPALAMGIDPQIDDVMGRPPRRPGQHLIDRHMWFRILGIGLLMGAITLATIDLFLPGGLIDGSESVEVARTAGFTTLVLAQLFNALNARSDSSSAFHRIWVNRWLWGALGVAAGLQVLVVQLPLLQGAFGTRSLTASQWAVTVLLSSIILWVEEVAKFVRRRVANRTRTARSDESPRTDAHTR